MKDVKSIELMFSEIPKKSNIEDISKEFFERKIKIIKDL